MDSCLHMYTERRVRSPAVTPTLYSCCEYYELS